MIYYEYMLLSDGSVHVISGGLASLRDVQHELIRMRGVSYYWPVANSLFWYAMIPISTHTECEVINLKDLPDALKLVVMLE